MYAMYSSPHIFEENNSNENSLPCGLLTVSGPEARFYREAMNNSDNWKMNLLVYQQYFLGSGGPWLDRTLCNLFYDETMN